MQKEANCHIKNGDLWYHDRMWSECAYHHETVVCSGMALQCIWQVDAGASYSASSQSHRDPHLIAIRTYAGEGSVEVNGHGRFALTPYTLLLVEWHRVRYYGTTGERWRFCWFEFTREGGMAFPWYELFAVASTPWEETTVAETFTLLSLPDYASRAAASARFNAMLYDWAARRQHLHEHSDPQRQLVYQAIGRMRHHLAQPISISALADEAGMSARHFRTVFRQVMGESPKAYYTNLRLQQAAHALRMGTASVTQLAEQLGYATPFHLSSAFKAKFGSSPSAYQRQR